MFTVREKNKEKKKNKKKEQGFPGQDNWFNTVPKNYNYNFYSRDSWSGYLQQEKETYQQQKNVPPPNKFYTVANRKGKNLYGYDDGQSSQVVSGGMVLNRFNKRQPIANNLFSLRETEEEDLRAYNSHGYGNNGYYEDTYGESYNTSQTYAPEYDVSQSQSYAEEYDTYSPTLPKYEEELYPTSPSYYGEETYARNKPLPPAPPPKPQKFPKNKPLPSPPSSRRTNKSNYNYNGGSFPSQPPPPPPIPSGGLYSTSRRIRGPGAGMMGAPAPPPPPPPPEMQMQMQTQKSKSSSNGKSNSQLLNQIQKGVRLRHVKAPEPAIGVTVGKVVETNSNHKPSGHRGRSGHRLV